MKKPFNDIRSRDNFAHFLDIPRKKLTYILYKKKVDAFYTEFSIPKKHGGERIICAPHGYLKSIQRKLAAILYDCTDSDRSRCNISHGFERNRGIITNAMIHRNKKYVLNVDLKDFFTSFHFGRVRGFFHKDKSFLLPIEVATVIAQLTCFKGVLPQGAPTSPIITNLICKIFDFRLLKLVKKYRLDYSRYADDLTFSTNDARFIENKDSFLLDLTREVTRAGFSINERKIRLQMKGECQIVTGLVVNKKINVRKFYYRETRAMAHSLYSQGEFMIDGKKGDISQLEGRFEFIDALAKFNNRKDNETHDAFHLSGKELEYSRFLFFKYFYANKMPVIVTEGKTDIRYLKAALKKMFSDYPDLIVKKEGGFEFKVYFLPRDFQKRLFKRLKYFFRIGEGADSLVNLCFLFDKRKTYQYKKSAIYYDYFARLGSRTPFPVVILYDNEIKKKDRPLYKMKTHLSTDEVEFLEKNLYLPFFEDGNLYLLTNCLVNGSDSCEIEELFFTNVLSQKINGKTFSLKESNPDQFYGKEVFSNFVYRKYNEIDFSNFRPMLDALVKIIKKCATKNPTGE